MTISSILFKICPISLPGFIPIDIKSFPLIAKSLRLKHSFDLLYV